MSMKRQHQIIFFLIFLLPGLLTLAFSLHLALQGIGFARNGQPATAVLVGYERQGRLRVGHRLCPILEFSHRGSTVRFTDGWCNKTPAEFPEGTRLPVLFDASNPANARINDFASLFATSLIVGVIAVPWLLLGGTLIVRTR